MDENRIQEGTTLLEALGQLNRLPGRARMTLFVLDAEDRLTGTLTDGDIRRALLRGETLDSPVENAACRRFMALTPGLTARESVELLRLCRRKGIGMVPETDADSHLTGILDLSECTTRLPLKAVLMAGGLGERLRPLTLATPKPLLEIEGKAIIDYNVEALAACGVRDIYVCTRYLAEKIEAHFAEKAASMPAVRVHCVRETHPLGTIGAVALTGAAREEGETLVMNSDLLTTISFEEMYLRHIDTGADITIAVIPYQVSVPFAILSFDPADPDRVTGIDEKPSYSHYANAGIYIFSNRILRRLDGRNNRTDATDLIAEAIADGARVTYYTIKGTWIDVGSPTDFRQASELMRHHNSLNQ